MFGRASQAHRHTVAHEFSEQRAGDDGGRQADEQRVQNRFAHVRFAGRLIENTHRRNRPGMRRHQTVHHGETRNQRNAQAQQRRFRFARDREQNGNQQHQTDGEEHRDADEERDEHHRPVKIFFTQRPNQPVGDHLGPAGLRQHFTQNAPQPDDHRNIAQHLAHAFQETFGHFGQFHSGTDPDKQGSQHQGDERIEFDSGDENDQTDDGDQRDQEQAGVVAHGVIRE